MTWTDLTSDWTMCMARLQERFPMIDGAVLRKPPPDRESLSQHLARTHDLTAREADEELRDWMFVEGLARQDIDMRAGAEKDAHA